jgi:AAA15 family ATPase/GTPase
MRLIGIKPIYFRAFGNSDWISLNSNLVVIYGPNGYGKTSISEALEWLLYGKTRRRERGETLSQREHQGSYRNVHAPEGHPTSVNGSVLSIDTKSFFQPLLSGSIRDFGFREDHGCGLTACFEGDVNGCAQGFGHAT